MRTINRRAVLMDEAWPTDWRAKLRGGPVGIGFDPASTEKNKSNPAAIAVTERVGLDFFVRSVVRYRSGDPVVHRAMLERAFNIGEGRRARRLCIDATSERLFATDLRRALAGRVPVELMIASENIEYLGTTMSVKVYLGGLVVRALEDGNLVLPRSAWLMKDLRQPMGSTFQADVDEAGNHADAFVAIAHSLHALIAGSGPVVVAAVPVGTHVAQPQKSRPGLVGPLAGAGKRLLSVVRNTLHDSTRTF